MQVQNIFNIYNNKHRKVNRLLNYRQREWQHNLLFKSLDSVVTPLWGKCADETHTPKSGNLESSETPENSELDCRGQNTSHWHVLYIIGKVLKCRCPNWFGMSHLDICTTSYGQKKGQESNWSFDSWLVKIGNRPNLGVCRWNANIVEKLLRRATSLLCTSSQSEVWAGSYEFPKSRESKPGQFRDSLGVPDKKPFGCTCRGQMQRVLYGGSWWLPPSPGRGEPSESVLPVACPNTESVSKCELTNLLVNFDAWPNN
jgi:hypothetical protein